MGIELTCKCGAELVASEAHGDLYARCPACATLRHVPRVERVAPIPDEDGYLQIEDDPVVGEEIVCDETNCICASCGETVPVEERLYCISCRTPHHAECWEAQSGCSVPTCQHGPQSRRHIKHAVDRKEALHPCPACGEDISPHAQRCRHCGKFTIKTHSKRRGGIGILLTKIMTALSLICSLLAMPVIFLTQKLPPLFLFSSLLPLGGFVLGIWGILRVNNRKEIDTGHSVVAGVGIGFSALSGLIWFIILLKHF